MQEWIETLVRGLSGYLGQNWEPVVAYATLVFAIVGYFFTRRRELAWKRTEFLFQQSQYIDKDADMFEVLHILEARHAALTVELVFDKSSSLNSSVRNAYKQKFDKLLGHIDLLAYAVLYVKTLSLKEAESFGWYIERIVRSPLLRDYCANNGYQDILTLAGRLKVLPDNEPQEQAGGTADGAGQAVAGAGGNHGA